MSRGGGGAVGAVSLTPRLPEAIVFIPVGHRSASPDVQCRKSRGKRVLVLSRTWVKIPVELLSFFKREKIEDYCVPSTAYSL